MKQTATLLAVAASIGLLPVPPAVAGPPTVNESARRIPVVYEVDVVVVGGSTGGVSAAAEAARRGATVFLATDRPYLGEDMCATRRLWLEGDRAVSPLAGRLLAGSDKARRFGPTARFAYQADKPTAGRHADTRPPRLLADGRWHSARSQSVQYDGDVTITLELKSPARLKRVHLFAYQRPDDFEVAGVSLSSSLDKQTWTDVSAVRNEKLGRGRFEEGAIDLSAPAAGRARYLRLLVRKGASSRRVLLGEIVVEIEGPADLVPATGPAPARRGRVLAPMKIKRALDEALLEAGVRFLTGCYATDLLRDGEGNLAGVVMANRSGRQAVVAKVIVDATRRAWVARRAGAEFQPFPAGPLTFRRIVVGGRARPGEGAEVRKLPVQFASGRGTYDVFEYTLRIAMADGSFASFARAEQVARDRTFDPGQVDESEVLFQVPPDPMKGRARPSGDWPGADRIDLDAFRPAGLSRLYVLGGCADLSRAAAAELLKPLSLMEVGERIGRAAAAEAKALPRPKDPTVPGQKASPAAAGDVREILVGVRPTQTGLATVPSEARCLPVLGRYDVAVVGGGTGGAPAGIGASRHGAGTLIVEYLHGLGGVGTLGLIGKYYHGYRKGFTAQVDRGVREIGAAVGMVGKMEYWRRENRRGGADIWFGALGCGAFVEDGRVKGVVVATPEGRGVVLANTVIDSTGNADVAASAGAACIYTDGSAVAVQGTGLPPWQLGASYTNTDYTFADDSDVVDIWHLFVYARQKYRNAYDLAQIVDTRERRRVVGDFVLSPLDQINRRTYPDTVVMARSDFDSHGFTVHPVFTLRPPGRKSITAYIPYRCLLPKGLDGVLVTGLGISAHRDAIPIVRMQPDIQNQGYAAGVAASMAAKGRKTVRRIDIKALQKHLVELGSLPASVLTDADSYPMPTEKVEAALRRVVNGYEGLAVILAESDRALPMLRRAYAAASDEHKLIYAHILAMNDDATGVETLIAQVRSRPWDKGWNFKGMGQYGGSVSRVDGYIIALGRTRDRRALVPILEKIRLLDAKGAFSHHRAVAMASETLGDPAAAAPLAELLAKPGMAGHALAARGPGQGPFGAGREGRNNALRELILARALYRCGDHEGLGEKILKGYVNDPCGHYARHAQAVLRGK